MSVVATGIDMDVSVQPRPVLRVYDEPAAKAASAPPELRLETGEYSDAPKMPVEPALAAVEINPAGAATNDPVVPVHSEATDEDTAPVTDPGHDEAPVADSAPQAITVEDPFIPPPPVEPTKTSPVVAAADPFREADMLNAAPPPEKKRGPSLFQRMTGTGKSRREEVEEPQVTAPPQKEEKAEIQETPMPVETAPATEVAAPTEPVAMQPRLKGVDSHDRVKTFQSEDDLLDIPAFLRRQAN